MAKQEELNRLKEEYEALTTKLSELTSDELKQVTGGYTTNEDGTYSFGDGEMYSSSSPLSNYNVIYEVVGDFPRVSLFSCVDCLEYEIDGQGNLLRENGKHLIGVYTLLSLNRYYAK